MRLVLYEPDIPQNAGTMMRMAACLGVGLDIVEPCGFLLDDRRLRRAGLDYRDRVPMRTHESWPAFRRWLEDAAPGTRILLLTTQGETAYTAFAFRPGDVIMVGRESGGVPEAVHAAVDARLRIPMAAGNRSLNVAVAGAMALGEALRQTEGFPG
jgi:tRNA (cytidine/uridine-2'-O-)-methyltransferase